MITVFCLTFETLSISTLKDSEFIEYTYILNRLIQLEYFSDAITDLYVDYNNLKGINVNQKASKLLPFLEKYNPVQIIAFFKQDNKKM